MSAFLSIDLLTDFAAFYFTDFIDWRYTHSWFVFSTQLVNYCPLWMKELYLCTAAPLLYLLSDLPPPPFPMYSIYRADNMWLFGGGGGVFVEMYCGPYPAGVLHSVSDQIQNLQNCFTTPSKMTSEDDIEGLVSLNSFVHGCSVSWEGRYTPPISSLPPYVLCGRAKPFFLGSALLSLCVYSSLISFVLHLLGLPIFTSIN